MKYYIRTTKERILDKSFNQIPYLLLVDKNKEFQKIFAQQILSICDDDIILLEDDIILCKNFKNRIEKIVAEKPNDIINFFTKPLDYINSQYTDQFSYNQCTYYPKDKLKNIGLYIDKHYNEILQKFNIKKQNLTVESLVKFAIKELNYNIYIQRPCLVQHIDTGSLINHNTSIMRRSPYFIDYLDELNLSYEDCQDIKIQKQLYDYMCKQFEDIDKYYKIFNYKSKSIDSLIVGYGVVGRNLYEELKVLNLDIYDKYKTEVNTKRNIKYDFCFICVDTPCKQGNVCDISQIENALQENDSYIYIIKSTILPGITEMLKQKYHKHIIVSPEYYGETQHCNNFNFNFTILGGEKDDCIEVQQLLQKVYDARHLFRITDSKTAELTKYMENSYLGMKVAFCNQFFRIAESYDVNYEELRELFILDERINPSHTFVYRDKPYYDSHCLNKDIFAIAKSSNCNTGLLKNLIRYNNNCLKQYKNSNN